MNGESLLAAWCVSLLETCQKSWLIIQSIWIQRDKTNHNKVLQCLTWSCEENPVILKVCVHGRTNFAFFTRWTQMMCCRAVGCFQRLLSKLPLMKWSWGLVLSLVEFQECISQDLLSYTTEVVVETAQLNDTYIIVMNTNLLSSLFSRVACLFTGCQFAFFLLSSCSSDLSLTALLYYSLPV